MQPAALHYGVYGGVPAWMTHASGTSTTTSNSNTSAAATAAANTTSYNSSGSGNVSSGGYAGVEVLTIPATADLYCSELPVGAVQVECGCDS
jgi:hypothetical protein